MAHAVDVLGYLGWRLTGHAGRPAGAAPTRTGSSIWPAMRYSPEILAALGHDARSSCSRRRGRARSSARSPPRRPPRRACGRARSSSPAAATVRPRAWAPARSAAGGPTSISAPPPFPASGCRQFATSHAFRTLTSLSGEGYIFELCLRTGAFLTDWSVRNLFGADPPPTPAIYDRLEAEAAAVPPGADGLLLLPYWSGTMAPFWDPDARRCRGRPRHGPRPRPLLARACWRAWRSTAPWATARSRPRPASRYASC